MKVTCTGFTNRPRSLQFTVDDGLERAEGDNRINVPVDSLIEYWERPLVQCSQVEIATFCLWVRREGHIDPANLVGHSFEL